MPCPNDPLTGLPLRYGIESDFDHCQKDALRNHSLLYVVMIDIDHFKRINDSYGHPVGDMVLRHLAGTLKQNLRGNEPLYRYGGEEFLWLMQCKSVEEAKQSAHRLLSTIRTTPIPIADAPACHADRHPRPGPGGRSGRTLQRDQPRRCSSVRRQTFRARPLRHRPALTAACRCPPKISRPDADTDLQD